MTEAASTTPDCSKQTEWMWKSNPNPWSKSEPAVWSHYSDVENLIIEEAFSNKLSDAMLDDYYIDFKHKVQISSDDDNKQRPVQRVQCNREEKHLREDRFTTDPISPKRPFGGEYGWVSPFIIEVRRYLGLRRNQLPSKDEDIVPMIVEKAASGIIEEGKQIGKRCEAGKLANLLREKKDKGIEEVWKCCAYLYSLESFLYKKLNEATRLIGSNDHEKVWRRKVRTLGPFCLLLWDNPFNKKLKTNMTLYRGAKLTDDQIAIYKNMAGDLEEYRSFQSFTSCSRNPQMAENFQNANVLFVMEVLFAFTVDVSIISQYPHEEEELITPGVGFNVQRVEFDNDTKKHVIYLQLRQRFSGKYIVFFTVYSYNREMFLPNESIVIYYALKFFLSIHQLCSVASFRGGYEE